MFITQYDVQVAKYNFIKNTTTSYQLLIFRLGGLDYKYKITLPYPNILNKH